MPEISWPSDEPIPISLGDAFKAGWEPYDTRLVDLDSLKDIKNNDENPSESFRVLLRKETEQFDLYVEIDIPIALVLDGPQEMYKPKAYKKEPEKAPKPERLFDVHFVPPKQTIVRVLAEDENAACELAVDKFFQTGALIRKPDAQKRPVFAWRQKNGRGLPRAQRVRVPKQLTRRNAVAAS